jgi:periplasmic protein TonB
MIDAINFAANQRRMMPFAIVVIGLHAALLAIPVRSVGSSHAMVVAQPLSVRMLAPSEVGAVEQTASQGSPTIADAAVQRPVQPRSVTEPATSSAPHDKVPTADTKPNVSPPLPSFGLVVPDFDSDDDYYVRSMLTLAPRPVDPILVDYPTIDKDQGHYRSELTLFIDETGRVVRVRVDGASLPPALEAAARSAFTNARFLAGQADGRAVKSRIRIEVEFDNRPPEDLK